MTKRLYEAVYVWEAPVRLCHWVTVICLLTLAVTGFMIGNPPALRGTPEAYQGYWFGWVRVIHFTAGYILLAAVALRLYWVFRGNHHSRWHNYLPLRKAQWEDFVETVRFYLLRPTEGRRPVGHNSLAATTYVFVFLVMLFQVVSGFAMYAAMSDSWLPRLFAWFVPLMGSDMAVRQWHHLMLWVFVVFLLVHIYISYFNEHEGRRGLFDSIVTGWKFVEKR